MQFRPDHRVALVRALAVTLLIVGVSAAVAQIQPGPDFDLEQARLRVQEIQQHITSIQQQAIEAHPELLDQREEFQELVKVVMSEKGFDANADQAAMDSLRTEAENPDLTPEEQQDMMLESRQAEMRLRQGQEVAMRDSTLINAQEDLRESLLDAMRELEPEVDALLDEFDRLRYQILKVEQTLLEKGQPEPEGEPSSEHDH
jgi:cytochrome c556